MKRLSRFLLFALLAVPGIAQARTTLFFDAPAQARPAADVPIILRARLERPINALRLVVRYDPSRLTISSVNDSDSVVRHWLDFSQNSASGSLTFEGIIPGGVGPGLTDTVTITRLAARFLRPGPATLTIEHAAVYAHRAEPEEDEVLARVATIVVHANAPEISIVSASAATALDADVHLVREPTLHDGAWSLIFDVRTMQGTASVRVRERFLGLGGVWKDAVSPYRLSDQQLLSIIEVGIASGSDTQSIRIIMPGRLQAIIVLLLMVTIGVALRWLLWRKG